MTRMKRGTTNHRPLTTRSAFLSAAFAHATAGGLWFSGQWSVVFPTLFPSLSSVKIFLRDEGVASTASTDPQVRHGESVSWRTRNARATLRWLEKTRRRLHGAA
jgi:hypothetical protein